MAESTEVIEHQMEETRHRLAENLEKLTKQTADTVEDVSASVSQSVESVQETVEAVTETVQQTVGGVKDFFDFPGHVDRHPWLVFGGSVAAGYCLGCLFSGHDREERRAVPDTTPTGWPTSTGASHGEAEQGGRPPQPWSQPSTARPAGSAFAPAPSAQPRPEQPSAEAGWFDGISKTFGPALEKLKGMAIGATLSLARDALTGSLASGLGDQLREVFDDTTRRLGGKPLPQGQGLRSQEHGTQEHRPEGHGQPGQAPRGQGSEGRATPDHGSSHPWGK